MIEKKMLIQLETPLCVFWKSWKKSAKIEKNKLLNQRETSLCVFLKSWKNSAKIEKKRKPLIQWEA